MNGPKRSRYSVRTNSLLRLDGVGTPFQQSGVSFSGRKITTESRWSNPLYSLHEGTDEMMQIRIEEWMRFGSAALKVNFQLATAESFAIFVKHNGCRRPHPAIEVARCPVCMNLNNCFRMGWDVVGIGLSHDLPVDDPYAMGETIAQRMKANVRLEYRDEYRYDAANNVVSESNMYDLITLTEITIHDAHDIVGLIVSNYQAQQIVKQAGMDRLCKATFTDCTAESFFSDLESPAELYEIWNANDDIKIYKETIDINVDIPGRWHWWETYFHDVEHYRDLLYHYRMQFYQKARLFGCRAVIICSDQGPGQYIYDEMHQSAEQLEAYARSYAYLNGNNWLRDQSVEAWKQRAKHLLFSSVFQNQPVLSPGDFVEVVYDNFADLQMNCSFGKEKEVNVKPNHRAINI